MASSIIEPERNRCSTPPPPGEVSLPETGSILRDVHPETVDMTRPLCTIPIGRNDRLEILFSSSSRLSPPRPPFSFFFRRGEGGGLSRSFTSPRKCARVELQARVSWRAPIGVSSLFHWLRVASSDSLIRYRFSIRAPAAAFPPFEEFPSRTVEPATAFSRDRKTLLSPLLPLPFNGDRSPSIGVPSDPHRSAEIRGRSRYPASLETPADRSACIN